MTLEMDNWQSATWEGSEREQLRRWRKLTLTEKLQTLEQMQSLGMKLLQRAKARGQPIIDPVSGSMVQPAMGKVAEPPPGG